VNEPTDKVERKGKKKKVVWTFHLLDYRKKLFCQIVKKNSSNFLSEYAPQMKPQLRLFYPEPELL
jgi:hypothetical protein